MRKNRSSITLVVFICCLCLIGLSACGSRNRAGEEPAQEAATPVRTRVAVPTMPPARFGQPTSVVDVDKAKETQEELAANAAAELVSSGEFIYGNKCAECHGEGATGTEEGGSLVGLTMDETVFTDLLRTGGELGNDHLFGPNAISPDGVKGIYAYLSSLK